MDERTFTYITDITSRPWHRLLLGLLPRVRQYVRNWYWRRRAINRGASIGKHTVICPALAKHANRNLEIGDYCSILSAEIDLRGRVVIGDYVAIGHGTRIVRGQHNIDSPRFEANFYELKIGNYCWLLKTLILPKCMKIGEGAVCGAGSVVTRDVSDMAVVVGNPAVEKRKRKVLPSAFCPAWSSGNDLPLYWEAMLMKWRKH